jgi:hypothetical protein
MSDRVPRRLPRGVAVLSAIVAVAWVIGLAAFVTQCVAP